MSFRIFKLTVEYDGTHYAGWQIQPNKKTVQGCLQDVLRRVTQENVNVIGASRTDAGVHALGQVAQFHTKSRIKPEKLFIALNGLLPEDISVKEVVEKKSAFHAQKGAKKKTYRYLIWNQRHRAALLKDRAWHVWVRLDVPAMKRASKYLIGQHDFTAFRAHQSDTKTSIRKIHKILIRASEGSLTIEVTGNGFLKYMIRNIVGTLVEVGKGKLKPDDVRRILLSEDRKKAGATAPACGLYLVSIQY